ncbi:MAG: FliI/YscN family ATPase [Planctomycetaceae bacterium]|nr:FliI/YscN family ATPase [Planctomycetaceae bacterium]
MAGRCDAFRNAGKLRSARGLLRATLPAFVGECCRVSLPDGEQLTAEVVGFDEADSQLMCFDSTAGLRPGLEVIGEGRRRTVPVGDVLMGRVVDGIARPLDGRGPLLERRRRPESTSVPDPLMRGRISQPLVTGQRVIDGLLTIGKGQRVGLFAGSGVGKSTLLGEIARGAQADMNVICLVGERGREVLPFLEDCLGEAGRERSVVVVATSDQTPLMRIKAVLTAVTIAEDFRDQGLHVLFFLDSLTRLAIAQRELGLLLGEPPGSRGYPPSVQSLMAEVLERLGCSETGAITGLITVLVEGDDMDEPIADAARGILDGHIILSRQLASQGHYPAVDVASSVSRLFRDITTPEHQTAAKKVRLMMSTYAEVADLIQIGAYKQGTSPQVDRAIQLMPAVRHFLQQSVDHRSSWTETEDQLRTLAQVWPW